MDVSKEVKEIQKAVAAAKRKLEKLLKLHPKEMPVGKTADLMYEVRDLKALFNKLTTPIVEDVLTPVHKTLEDHFIMTLAAGESSGVQGATARVQVTPYAVPIFDKEDAKAREKFLKYVVKTSQYDLLTQDIIKRDAVRERWDDKKQIPGVTVFNTKKVSCTKLNGKKAAK